MKYVENKQKCTAPNCQFGANKGVAPQNAHLNLNGMNYSYLRTCYITWFSSFFGTLLTFHFVAFCWIFFRSPDMPTAFAMIARIFTATPFQMIGEMITGYYFVFGVMLVGFLMHWWPSQWKEHMRG